ncbi:MULTISPECIES: TorD/DmsD family molecular chaperone [Citrobacter]|uniref:Molecular chaperone n=1 Tax=Citrobacter telavivensis TaxID=2653932 RepID=A0A6L5E4X2_9ENTR|nr:MULTISPECIES: molecular chaperone TorD family protein [Citrobacter]MPQ49753.1 molecular chaperone [Citrobacter telavivensis]QFS72848.1 molecular chaperone [Citrobacter telavivensis]CAI9398284.1 Tat proofreading chaperone DmsD [Citrobacter sp. T1.2D-1]
MDLFNNTLTDSESSGLLLRDFFHSRDGESLKAACIALDPPAVFVMTASAWQEVEYDYNALFIGPCALKAAPYASVYLEEEGLVMGKTTRTIRDFMASIGLSINSENNIPDDHISYVIELAIVLSANVRQSPQYRDMLARYINDYVALWVPEFIARIKRYAQTATLHAVAEKLSYWIDELKRDYLYEQ